MATRRVVLNNKQREKTPAQQSREMLVLEETGREIGKEGQGTRTDLCQDFGKGDFRWNERVGEDVGLSHETVRQATNLFRMAYPDQYVNPEHHDEDKYDVPDTVRNVAQEQVAGMDDTDDPTSFHGAHTAVKEAIEDADEYAELEAILEHNDHRDKKFSQKMGEAKGYEELARENAKDRMITSTGGEDPQPLQNFADPDGGLSRDAIAEHVNIGSGETYRKANKVYAASLDEDIFAQDLVTQIDRGEESIHGAHTKWREHKYQQKSTGQDSSSDNGDADTDNNEQSNEEEEYIESIIDEITHWRDNEEMTQAAIGDEMGWSRSKVKQHVAVIDQVGTDVLDLARRHQEGRVPSHGTGVPSTEWTEYWFRSIGKDDYSLYDLSNAPYFQQWFMAWFVYEERCDVGKTKVGLQICHQFGLL
jgi:predicted XRE-type DNA-binding protein